jgi:hypothetical protein
MVSENWLLQMDPVVAQDPVARSMAWAFLASCFGVRTITDMGMITQPTLDLMLMKPTAALKREEPSAFNLVRRHNQRKRQPGLPE